MTNELRERAIKYIEMAKRMGSEMTIEGARKQLEQKQSELEYWEDKKIFEAQYKRSFLKGDIAYWEAVIEVLTEMQVLEAEKEAVETVIATIRTMPRIKTVRSAVVTMANKLGKIGYTQSEAFRMAWRFVKALMATHERMKLAA